MTCLSVGVQDQALHSIAVQICCTLTCNLCSYKVGNSRFLGEGVSSGEHRALFEEYEIFDSEQLRPLMNDPG